MGPLCHLEPNRDRSHSQDLLSRRSQLMGFFLQKDPSLERKKVVKKNIHKETAAYTRGGDTQKGNKKDGKSLQKRTVATREDHRKIQNKTTNNLT